jgi:mono/diheme cytochrome c family protein
MRVDMFRRFTMRTLISTVVLIGISAVTGIAADAKAGQAIYDKSCKSCHGSDGTPNAASAKMMKVDMKDFKSAEVQGMSDADIKKVIADGKGKMKAIKTVTGADADNVVAYIRTLKK